MPAYFAIANREKMRPPFPHTDRGPAAKPRAQRRWREEGAASRAKVGMARYKDKSNRAPNSLTAISLFCHSERSRGISNYSPRIPGAKSIQRGDQLYFFGARPVFDLLLPRNRITH